MVTYGLNGTSVSMLSMRQLQHWRCEHARQTLALIRLGPLHLQQCQPRSSSLGWEGEKGESRAARRMMAIS